MPNFAKVDVDVIRAWGTLAAICLCAAYLPMMLYGMYKLWIYRHNILIRKRLPTLTIIASTALILDSISWLLWVFIFENKQLKDLNETDDDDEEEQEIHEYDQNRLIAILRFVSMLLFVTTILLRFWMIYFEISFINSINNQNWKLIINKNFYKSTNQKSKCLSSYWFVNNKKTFGNWYFMRRIGIITFILCSTVGVAAFMFMYVLPRHILSSSFSSFSSSI